MVMCTAIGVQLSTAHSVQCSGNSYYLLLLALLVKLIVNY